MKIVLCAIDAKYIHPNLALRLIRASCPYPCRLLEFTVKTDPDAIAEAILAEDPDVVGFSVYLWNVKAVKRIAAVLRGRSRARLVAGGPEVAYDAERHLFEGTFDFIASGEGERTFAALCKALADESPWREIPGLAWRDSTGIHVNPAVPIANLRALPSPYRDPDDLPGLAHRIQYLEWSRGCPFACTYCVAPLEGGVRRFPIERVEAEIDFLLDRGARTFKFLDRSFNVRPAEASALFDFVIACHRPGVVFQFEIVGDLLKPDMIRRLNEDAPIGLIRFEIGVQSTNAAANAAVARVQDNARLFENVRALVAGGRVVVHLDLIAGLPGEDLASFRRTFDETFSLFAPELQLGFLKMLPGTPLRRDAGRLGYDYDPEPPYRIRKSPVLSADDLARIERVERVLEHFWNRGYAQAALTTIHDAVPSMFSFMESFHDFLDDRDFSFLDHQLHDLYVQLDAFASRTVPAVRDAVRAALVDAYLHRATVRPIRWWI
ncbi:MAG: DUF4080 domain-containing protein [Candidatus Izemoplasmatales bacterium]